MVVHRVSPMPPKHFRLRVYSVKEDGHGSWEVRAAEQLSPDRLLASLFYHESNALNLPPMDSSIHVLLNDRLSETKDTQKMYHATPDAVTEVETDPALYQPGG